MLGISDNRKTGGSRHNSGKMVFDKCAVDVFGKQTISREIHIFIYRSKKPGPPKEFGYPFCSLKSTRGKGHPFASPGVSLLCQAHLLQG